MMHRLFRDGRGCCEACVASGENDVLRSKSSSPSLSVWDRLAAAIMCAGVSSTMRAGVDAAAGGPGRGATARVSSTSTASWLHRGDRFANAAWFLTLARIDAIFCDRGGVGASAQRRCAKRKRKRTVERAGPVRAHDAVVRRAPVGR